jgi:hypothetical protein
MQHLFRSLGVCLLVLWLTGCAVESARWATRSNRPDRFGKEVQWYDLECADRYGRPCGLR